MPTEMSTDITPHSRLVLENAAQVSNQATAASATAFEIALEGHHVVAGQLWVTLCGLSASEVAPMTGTTRMSEFDEARVLASIAAEPPVDYSDAVAAFLGAARHGSAKVVHALLEQGIEVPDWPEGVLKVAIEAGNIEVVRSLLRGGADTKVLDSEENTALMVAVSSGHRDIIDLMIDAPYRPPRPTRRRGRPQPEHEGVGARGRRRTPSVGFDLDAGNTNSQTALMLACERADERTVRRLLNSGASIDLRDYGRESTALAYAARGGSASIVRLLLKHGADPNERAVPDLQNQGGDPVLIAAARAGSTEACNVLLEDGAAVDARSSTGCTPIHVAARNGHALLIRLLLGWKANPHVSDRCGVTPLMAATMCSSDRSVSTVRSLLAAGVEVDARDQDGNTALMHAISRRQNHEAI